MTDARQAGTPPGKVRGRPAAGPKLGLLEIAGAARPANRLMHHRNSPHSVCSFMAGGMINMPRLRNKLPELGI
jgi:hypothetical protein